MTPQDFNLQFAQDFGKNSDVEFLLAYYFKCIHCDEKNNKKQFFQEFCQHL